MTEHHPRAPSDRSVVVQGDRSRDQRPIEALAVANFVGAVSQAAQRDVDLGHDLVWPQLVFPFARCFGHAEKRLAFDFSAFQVRSGECDRGAQRNQSRCQARRAYEIGWALVGVYRVVAVVSIRYERTALTLGEQSEALSVVPASGSLTQVAGYRAHGCDLRAGDSCDGLDQRRKMSTNRRMSAQVSQRGHCTDADLITAGFDVLQIADCFQADHAPGRGEILFQGRDQVRPAGEDFRLPPGIGKQGERLGKRARTGVLEAVQLSSPPATSALMTLSGVSGKVPTRTPMALATALEIAAPGEITGGSPSPMTPRSS